MVAAPETPQSEGSTARRRGRARLGLAAVAALVGLTGLAVSLAVVMIQVLPRRFTVAQQRAIISWEVGRRWRAWPAGRIFPSDVRYQLPTEALADSGQLLLTAARVGIAPQAPCTVATDAAAATVLDSGGCQAVMRATYTDATDTFVATVGVAVLRGNVAARKAARELGAGRELGPTVRPVAFAGTAAARFGVRQRQLSTVYAQGPYVIMVTAGYADGRPRVDLSSDEYAQDEMSSLSGGLVQAVGGPLGASPAPPSCPGAPGC